MAKKEYNVFFEELVGKEINKEDAPVEGMIAYALYKLDKLDFIVNYKNENSGTAPSSGDIESYCNGICTARHIKRYRDAAHTALENWLNKQFQQAITETESKCNAKNIDSLNDVLTKKIPDFKKEWEESLDRRKRGFWYGVGQSIVGAGIFVILTALFIICWSMTNKHKVTISPEGIEISEYKKSTEKSPKEVSNDMQLPTSPSEVLP